MHPNHLPKIMFMFEEFGQKVVRCKAVFTDMFNFHNIYL